MTRAGGEAGELRRRSGSRDAADPCVTLRHGRFIQRRARRRLTDQRRALPDAPGVYLFKDAGGRALYVGKAKSIRKRVGSHFSGRSARGADEMLVARRVDRLRRDRRTRPRPCSPSSASSSSTARPSTSGCGTTSPTPTSASRSTSSSRASTSRVSGTAPSGPTSARSRARSGCARRSTCWASSSRTARATGPSPAARRAAPASTTTSSAARRPASTTSREEDYRANIDAIIRFLSGQLPADRARPRAGDGGSRGGAGVRAGGGLPQPAAGGALAVRAPAGGERHGRHARRDRRRGRRTRTRTRRCSRSATACWPTARASISRTARGAPRTRSRRSSRSSTTRRRSRYPAEIVGPASLVEADVVRQALEERREAPVELRHAQRGDKRRLYELAERNARLAHRAGQAAHPAPPPAARRRAQRPARGARHGCAAGADRGLRHLEPRPVAHGRVDGRVRGRRAAQVRLPALQDPRARGPPGRLRGDAGGPGAGAWRSGWSSGTARRTTRPATRASRRCRR